MNKTIHQCLTLRGEKVKEGIKVEGGRIPFNPRWGMTRHSPNLLGATPASDGMLSYIHVATTEHGPVIISCEGEPDRELVLVKEYRTGSGAKRFPNFTVEFGEGVKVLSEARTAGGSGYGCWSLVSAPLEWADNIAAQFENERDVRSRKISFNPDLSPPSDTSRSTSSSTRTESSGSRSESSDVMEEALREAGLL